MAAVRGRDTKPEVSLRRALHALGLRYRLNVRRLPGSPDVVLPRFRTAIFVHGCFWHGHDCRLFVVPKTRPDFWLGKISANQIRDRRNHAALVTQGWRVATVWECALRGRASHGVDRTAADLAEFVRTDTTAELYIRDDGAHVGDGYGQRLVVDLAAMT